MRPERWRFVPTALGILAVASAAAEGREMVNAAVDPAWPQLVRFEVEFLGGLWLLGGLSPRWARFVALAVFLGIAALDLVGLVAGSPPRPVFGHVVVEPWWLLASDLVILFALWRWSPSRQRTAQPEPHPSQFVILTGLAAMIGVAVDWTQVGCFPIVAVAERGGFGSTSGLTYTVYLPDGYYRSTRRWPAILALHGSGTVGDDIGRVRASEIPRLLEEGRRLPFVVIAPLSPRQGWDVEALDAVLGEALRKYRLDEDRIYLVGASMGGNGAWMLGAAHPERFAAVVPVCGWGDPASAARLRGVPTWAFHGDEDTVVRPERSWEMVTALEEAGGDVMLTIYPGVGHDSAKRTYADPTLYDWLRSHRRRRPPGGDAGPKAAPDPPPGLAGQ